MAAGKGRWFLQAGFLISWLGLASAAAGAEPLPAPDASDCSELPPVLAEAPEGLWTQRYGTKYLLCGPAASDGTGAVIGATAPLTDYVLDIWGWNPGGGGSNTGIRSDTFAPYGQPNGFLSFSMWVDDIYLSYLDSRTWQFTHYPPEPHSLMKVAEDPRGGLRALFIDGTLKAYGPTGETLWSTALALSESVAALGVDAQGHTLVLAASGQGLWVDASGQPGPSFRALTHAPSSLWGSTYELVPQAAQGLFLGVPHGDTKTWTAYAPMQPHASPAPAWLSADAARPLIRLPSGKGYLRWGRSAVSLRSCPGSG